MDEKIKIELEQTDQSINNIKSTLETIRRSL